MKEDMKLPNASESKCKILNNFLVPEKKVVVEEKKPVHSQAIPAKKSDEKQLDDILGI
jgi:hypothetical protein